MERKNIPPRGGVPFSVELRQHRGHVVVTPHGVISGESTMEFTRELDRLVEDEAVGGVVLELSRTESVSAKAFGAIVSALIILRYRHCRLVVAAPRPNFLNLMALTGLDAVVPVCSTLDEGIKKLH